VTSATPYRIDNVETLLTPALAIYPDIVDCNIAATVRLLGNDPNRWRPHLKTAKLGFIMRRLAERGIVQAKCSTTVELAAACGAGIAGGCAPGGVGSHVCSVAPGHQTLAGVLAPVLSRVSV